MLILRTVISRIRKLIIGIGAAVFLLQLPAAAQWSPSVPAFQFAVFYNGLLEFTWNAPLAFNGRVHANGDIYAGSSAPLTFGATVTASGSIQKPYWGGHDPSNYTAAINYNGSPGFITNFPAYVLPIGTNNTPSALHQIIEIPPPGVDPLSPLGQQRYYNKARVVILVSNSIVSVAFKTSSTDLPLVRTAAYSSTNYSGIVTNFPFLSVSNIFQDDREQGKTVRVSQIDVGRYGLWASTNAGLLSKFPTGNGMVPNILYIADFRTHTTSELMAVRLINGSILPTNALAGGASTGWTVSTANPLYVLGNYNANGVFLGTTNTAASVPASLVSDALTFLSPNWTDANSWNSLGSRYPASMTVNAAIITGNVPSTGSSSSQFSGSLHNLPRLLENWNSGIQITLNTSLINLYASQIATNQFQNPGVYYNAPTRLFSFDNNFNDPAKLPPGTPIFYLSAATIGSVSFTAENLPQFSVTGVPGARYTVETTTNMIDWQSLQTNTSPFTFLDPAASLVPPRFYRAAYLP